MKSDRTIILFAFVVSTDFSLFVLGSKEAVVKVGDSTILHCSVSPPDDCIIWIHNHPHAHHRENHGDNEIYNCDSGVNVEFHRRFRVDRNPSTGKADLHIKHAEKDDAGIYECQEMSGSGKSHRTKLFVIDNDPKCESSVPLQEVIGSNDCSIPPDEIRLTCSITYNGPRNSIPNLEWRRVGDNKVLDEPCAFANATEVNNYRLSCTVRLKAAFDLNGTSYICAISQPASTQYSCTTAAINMLYVFNTSSEQHVYLHVNEKFECEANSSQVCTYTWMKFQRSRHGEDDRWTESYKQFFTPTEEGSFRCEAQCPMRNHSCVTSPRFIHVVAKPSGHHGASNSTSKILTCCSFVLLIVLRLIHAFLVLF